MQLPVAIEAFAVRHRREQAAMSVVGYSEWGPKGLATSKPSLRFAVSL